MRIYDFYCNDCGKHFEKLVKHPEGVECPFCGSGKTEQRLGATSFKVGGIGTYDKRMKV